MRLGQSVYRKVLVFAIIYWAQRQLNDYSLVGNTHSTKKERETYQFSSSTFSIGIPLPSILLGFRYRLTPYCVQYQVNLLISCLICKNSTRILITNLHGQHQIHAIFGPRRRQRDRLNAETRVHSSSGFGTRILVLWFQTAQ